MRVNKHTAKRCAKCGCLLDIFKGILKCYSCGGYYGIMGNSKQNIG